MLLPSPAHTGLMQGMTTIIYVTAHVTLAFGHGQTQTKPRAQNIEHFSAAGPA